jgi:hypothetical protein
MSHLPECLAQLGRSMNVVALPHQFTLHPLFWLLGRWRLLGLFVGESQILELVLRHQVSVRSVIEP